LAKYLDEVFLYRRGGAPLTGIDRIFREFDRFVQTFFVELNEKYGKNDLEEIMRLGHRGIFANYTNFQEAFCIYLNGEKLFFYRSQENFVKSLNPAEVSLLTKIYFHLKSESILDFIKKHQVKCQRYRNNYLDMKWVKIPNLDKLLTGFRGEEYMTDEEIAAEEAQQNIVMEDARQRKPKRKFGSETEIDEEGNVVMEDEDTGEKKRKPSDGNNGQSGGNKEINYYDEYIKLKIKYTELKAKIFNI